MEKRTYYVNIGTGEISEARSESVGSLSITATTSEISELRRKMYNMHDSSFDSFIRAQIPFLEYHHDHANDQYDANLLEAYKLIHQLGDSETKAHIQRMGILSSGQK